MMIYQLAPVIDRLVLPSMVINMLWSVETLSDPILNPDPSHLQISFKLFANLSAVILRSVAKMVLHNPNNWHWVNKNVAPWAKQWFEDNLTKIEAEDGNIKARISKVISMDGDVDVSQRKGKVITIFDVKLVLEYVGSTPDKSDVSGTITVPEVAHDTEEDEYVVGSSILSSIASREYTWSAWLNKHMPYFHSLTSTYTPMLPRSDP